MVGRRLHGLTVAFVALLAIVVPAADPDEEKADKRFDELLARAKADPSLTNWQALRHAFSETSHYHPYDVGWRENLASVRRSVQSGDMKAAETAVVKLRDHEGWMRIDVLMQAEMIYDKLGEKEKAKLHHQFVEGFLMTIIVPGRGQSFEKPFEVLFIEEEYLVINILDDKSKQQALVEQGNHFFDVLTVEAKPDRPEHKFYFNIDMPHRSLKKMVQRMKSQVEAVPKK